MTNEEKARKIEEEYDYEAYVGAIEMAKWKDQQFDTMIRHFYALIQDGISFERAYSQVTGKDWQKDE